MTQTAPTKPTLITLHSVGTRLGVKQQEVSTYLVELNIDKLKTSKGKWGIYIEDFQKVKDLHKIKQENNVSAVVDPDVLNAQVDLINDNIYDAISADLEKRLSPPHKTIMFVGPTNSGKTYHGLEELFRDYADNPDKKHVYCGPLRLLAYEVYLKMVDKFGEDNVGFITGEEQINPDANLVATTAEMAPLEGNSILIDEAHWLVDPDRGHVWSRLLYSANFNNLYVITAQEAVELIEKLTSDTWYSESRVFTRKTAIVYGGQLSLSKIPPKSAVVCFSRKNVYTVASALKREGVKAGVLYGALPLSVRQKQLDDYIAGKYDVMVVTDVIGHGINLPIDNIVFTETTKFDGATSRDLFTWEGAQIAGRAGRFGLSDKGTVYTASGLPWFDADTDLVKQFVLTAAGKQRTDLEADVAYFAPKFTNFGLHEDTAYEATKLLTSVHMWQRKFPEEQEEDFMEPSLLATEKENLFEILEAIHIPCFPWDEYDVVDETKLEKFPVVVKELWQLASGPYDHRLPTIKAISSWLVSPYREESPALLNFYETTIKPVVTATVKPYNSLEEYMVMLESTLQIISEMKMAFTMFGKNDMLGELPVNVIKEAETVITKAIMRKVNLAVEQSRYGSCLQCKREIKPGLRYCEDCHSNR